MAATNQPVKPHITALRRFAIAMTLFNIAGHTFLGFEQSWAQPLVSLATAYSLEFLLELIDARANRRTPRFIGNFRHVVDYFLSAHITALACAMLIYANDELWVVAFATATAIGSKALFRLPVGSGTRHFFNPSNLGITATLLLFPWVGVAQPYMFTENLDHVGRWILPAVIVLSGSYLNYTLTRRHPLILSWLFFFGVQAFTRHLVFGTPLIAPLMPFTGTVFILYTFYMVSDPATTPNDTRGQIIFGAALAATYGLLMVNHIVFGLFFALTIICALRGIGLAYQALTARNAKRRLAVKAAPAVENGAVALEDDRSGASVRIGA